MIVKILDWPLNFGILFLFGAGLLSLASTAPDLFWLQLVWGAIASVIVLAVSRIDWRPFVNHKRFLWGIYIFSILLLGITYTVAPAIRGVRAWLPIGPFQFQTSELAKFALIVMYSWFFARGHIGIAHLRNILASVLYLLPPVGLVVLQPDMGSALILAGIWFSYLLISGLRWKHIFAAFFIFAITLVFMWTSMLRPYQKERIIGLFDPERDPLGVNYSVIQAKIAIGSAGFWGKGFGQGTQSQLGFLPEAQTDFIFAAFIEEWGLLGGIFILCTFLWILFRVMKIGMAADDNFAKLICLGAATLFLLHFILNVGSNLGLMPVIGVPFPFLSYGGSNLLVNALLIGVIQSIVAHRRF
jgi:rod shape determining protein RodA